MFWYICIILRDFQSFTLQKLHSSYIVKISLKIIKTKYFFITFYIFLYIYFNNIETTKL